MEDLIWKYIDRTLSKEEKIQFENLLHTDSKFSEQLANLTLLDKNIKTAVHIQMPEILKNKIVLDIENELRNKSIWVVFPLKYLIALVLLTAMVVAIALKFPGEESVNIANYFPDEKVMRLIGYISLSFLLLLGLDTLMSHKFGNLKSHIF